MKKLKIITNVVYWLVILFLVFIALITAFSVIKGPAGLRFFVVQSGSMEPKIKTGSVVLVAPQKEYKENDVITFLANPQANLKQVQATVTHRIIKVNNDEGRINYQTKGDANEDPDRELVYEKNVLGKVRLSIPYFGYVVGFTKTQTGFILLIVIPATLIIYSELVNIKKEIARLLSEWKAKRSVSSKAEKNALDVPEPESKKKIKVKSKKQEKKKEIIRKRKK